MNVKCQRAVHQTYHHHHSLCIVPNRKVVLFAENIYYWHMNARSKVFVFVDYVAVPARALWKFIYGIVFSGKK